MGDLKELEHHVPEGVRAINTQSLHCPCGLGWGLFQACRGGVGGGLASRTLGPRTMGGCLDIG